MSRQAKTALFLIGLLFASNALAEPFTAEHLVMLDRVGGPVQSADGSKVVFTVRSTNMEADKGVTNLWWTDITNGQTHRLTRGAANDTAPAWSPDGKFVYFLSSRNDSSQVWRVSLGDGEVTQITHLPLDVGTFRLTANADRLVVSIEVYLACEDLACTRAGIDAEKENPAKGVIYDHLFVRHWDHWLTARHSQLFSVALNSDGIGEGEPRSLTKGIRADIPSRVWGGNEEYAVSDDGSALYFAARLRDRDEPTSTNFDIYAAPMNGDGAAENLTQNNLAWDTQPVLSPDGRSLAYRAMARAGFESDRFQIMIRDLESGSVRALAADWDRSASSIAYSSDGAFLLVNVQDQGNMTLWAVNVTTGERQSLVDQGNVNSFSVGPTGVVFARDDLKTPSELYALAEDNTQIRQLTYFSVATLQDVEMGDFEQFSFTGAGNETVFGYVVKPAGFEKGKQYPVAFLIHGGPQGSFGNHFHYRWNPQTYAGQGFAAVFIDFHGSTGYGQAFTDSISGDWGGKPLLDLQLGLAAALDKYEFLNGEKVCALGASYGGFMINWIAGNWPERFDCLVNHDGVFDNRMMYYATEELWFPEWENGGPHFERPDDYEKYNPVNYVSQWETPMLVIHGELDYRIPVSQGIGAFTALQRRGIPSKFLYFPDENHWVQKPHNSLQWHEEVNQWLHHYLDQ